MKTHFLNRKITPDDLKKTQKPRENQVKFKSNGRSKGLSSTLAEYIPTASDPWNAKKANHLLRRMEFGSSLSKLSTSLNDSPSNLVKSKLDDAQTANQPVKPSWYNKYPPAQGSSQAEFQLYFEENFQLILDYQIEWTTLMVENPMREKMTLFWHDHFATEVEKYQLAPYVVRHFEILREGCLGNFKDLVYKIGKDHAMLVYLDGVENRDGSPNENYARELLELFTMGIGNYTQDDISEISRALTGFYVDFFTFEAGFYSGIHDDGEKTIFGRTGNFGYSDVIDIIFEERAEEIAQFICSKIYQFFLYETPNQTIVNGLADIFLQNDFEIRPVVEALLKSEHFYDSELMGAKYKSPVDFLMGMYAENELQPNDEFQAAQPNLFLLMEQFLFNPPNVAGWPGYRSWLSTTTFPYRWLIIEYVAYYASDNPQDLYEVDPLILTNQFEDPNNPYKLCNDLADFMLAVELPDDERQKLPDILLGGLPDYEWNLSFDGAAFRVLNLMVYIRKLPEYQLM